MKKPSELMLLTIPLCCSSSMGMPISFEGPQVIRSEWGIWISPHQPGYVLNRIYYIINYLASQMPSYTQRSFYAMPPEAFMRRQWKMHGCFSAYNALQGKKKRKAECDGDAPVPLPASCPGRGLLGTTLNQLKTLYKTIRLNILLYSFILLIFLVVLP